ncbi:MAG: hypothetical protein ABSD57_09105 [Verrucomicrobiota bacterium]|jgi:hypothetical protein
MKKNTVFSQLRRPLPVGGVPFEEWASSLPKEFRERLKSKLPAGGEPTRVRNYDEYIALGVIDNKAGFKS